MIENQRRRTYSRQSAASKLAEHAKLFEKHKRQNTQKTLLYCTAALFPVHTLPREAKPGESPERSKHARYPVRPPPPPIVHNQQHCQQGIEAAEHPHRVARSDVQRRSIPRPVRPSVGGEGLDEVGARDEARDKKRQRHQNPDNGDDRPVGAGDAVP